MNLPNKLTVLRVIMVPFFVFFYADRRGRSCKQMDRIDYFCSAWQVLQICWTERSPEPEIL